MRAIHAHCLIVLASLALACGLLTLFWPGLATNDSGHRLTLADALVHGASPGNPVAPPNAQSGAQPLPDDVYQHVFPPMMSVISAGLRWLSGTWGLMTLLQCWWFFASLGVLAQRVLGLLRGSLAWGALACVPLVWNTSIAMLPDAWVSAGLCTMLCVLLAQRAAIKRGSHQSSLCRENVPGLWLGVVTFGAGAIVFLGFRHNSITTLPVLGAGLGWLWVSCRALPVRCARRLRAALLSCAAFLAMGWAITQALPRALPWRDADVPATIMVWEHASMLRIAREHWPKERFELLAQQHSLDPVARAAHARNPLGATQRALDLHDWVMFNSLVYGPNAPLPARAIRNDGTPARDAFWSIMRDHPWLYARAKLAIARTVLGLRHAGPVLFITADEQGPPWTAQYGVHLGLDGPWASRDHASRDVTSTAPSATSVPVRILARFQRVTNATLGLWMPYLWFGLALLAWGAGVLLRRPGIGVATLLLGVAIAYYGAFFVLSPAFEWRYFLPSFVLLPLVIGASLARRMPQPLQEGAPGLGAEGRTMQA